MWTAIGSAHAFLVHFPIALVLAAAFSEVVYVVRREPRFGAAARVVVTFAAVASIPAAAAGFAAASGQAFGDALAGTLSVHRVAGVATPVLTVLAAGLAEGSRRSGQIWELMLFRVFLAAAAVTAVVAGFEGGELAHGADFSTSPLTLPAA